MQLKMRVAYQDIAVGQHVRSAVGALCTRDAQTRPSTLIRSAYLLIFTFPQRRDVSYTYRDREREREREGGKE